jgi:hypothetical protein
MNLRVYIELLYYFEWYLLSLYIINSARIMFSVNLSTRTRMLFLVSYC